MNANTMITSFQNVGLAPFFDVFKGDSLGISSGGKEVVDALTGGGNLSKN